MGCSYKNPIWIPERPSPRKCERMSVEGLDIIQSHSLSSISLQQIQTPEIHTSPSDARMRNQMSEPFCHHISYYYNRNAVNTNKTECTCTDGFRLHALLSWLHGTGLCSNSPSSAHSL